MNKPEAIHHNVAVIAEINIDIKGTLLTRRVHGDFGGLRIVNSKDPRFKSNNGLKNFITEATGLKETVIVLGHDIHQGALSEALSAGRPFVQYFRDEKNGDVTAHYYNIMPGQKTLVVRTDEEIQALLTGRQLVAA